MYREYEVHNHTCKTDCKCHYYDGELNNIPNPDIGTNKILLGKIKQVIFKHWRAEIYEYTALIKEINKLFEDSDE